MATGASIPRSRRAVLAAAAGAAAATVVSAMERPATVRAGADGDVVLGAINNADHVTTINVSTAGAAIAAATGFGSAIYGDSARGVGVQGNSPSGLGLHGSGSVGGVKGSSDDGYGVTGESISAQGVRGIARSSVGVLGHSGPDPLSAPTQTGVHGFAAQDGSARGVHGQTTVGQGVRGQATSGVGVHATATTGTALEVLGKARFSRSGKAIVVAGSSRVDVNLGAKGGLAGTPLCFANLLRYRPGVHVAAVRANYPSTGRMRIYLNKTVATSTAVAWMVLN